MCIVLLWWKLSIFTHLLQQRKVKVGNLGQWNSKHTLRLFTFKTAIICYVKGPFFYVSKLYASRSVQFSCSVVSGSLRHHGLQHARLPCLSLTPRACSNSCPLTWWCHPTILCSVIPFSCLPSFPASGSFQMSQFFASGGRSIGVSASTSSSYFRQITCIKFSEPSIFNIYISYKKHYFTVINIFSYACLSRFNFSFLLLGILI